jgi:hypothetical protein
MHAVWTLPEGDADYSRRWSIIRARFSRSVAPGRRRASNVRRRERGVWQRRVWEHHIRGADDTAACVRFRHFDPVEHGFADRPQDWSYSSVQRNIRAGRWEGTYGAQSCTPRAQTDDRSQMGHVRQAGAVSHVAWDHDQAACVVTLRMRSVSTWAKAASIMSRQADCRASRGSNSAAPSCFEV